VRAFGSITQPQLDALKDGIEVDGVQYGAIEATLEREQGSNVWLLVGLREGKNREVKNVLGALGLTVNRLIRVSFGPFQLSDLPIGAVEVVKARILREQLGKRLADEAGVDFDSEMPEPAATTLARGVGNPALRAAKPGASPAKQRKAMEDRTERFRFTDKPRQRAEDRPPAKDRPGSRFPRKPPREVAPPERRGPPRKVFNPDGTETVFEPKLYGRKPRAEADADGKPPFKKDFGDKPRTYGDKPRGDFGDRPKRAFGDKPKGDFGDRPKRPYSGRPAPDGADRPKRAYGDKPRGDFGDRPKRPYSGRPATDGADRPKRAYSDKPKGDFGDRPKRPYSGRPAADGAAPKRSYGAKPGGAPRGDFGDRPKRPYTGRPAADGGAPKRSYGAKPGGAPRGDGPPKRPRGSGPGGDRPRRPRPPKI
jgi:23S rRNA pseudouridine2605 synthase